MMSRELALGDIVTEFLLNTCLPHSRSRSKYSIEAGIRSCYIMALSALTTDDIDGRLIPLISGSVGEFYIEPMSPLCGDIDVMFHWSTQLAIPRGHPPPTQLPDEFHNYVKVLEIVDSHLPGFVYLQLRYLLTQCIDDDNYNAVECGTRQYLVNQPARSAGILPDHDFHGPALVVPSTDEDFLSIDHVYSCVRCLVWHPQAADWPTRHRNYGWPDSATLDRVVSNGCDVVGVAHRQCRQDEWMGKCQWRLSFSRAEIVLINSWMPVQQIVYHMLRVYAKSQRLTENTEQPVISNYNIKTLMLWACELKPRRCWTDDVNLVRICVELLHILASWLTDVRCQHYFINDCNLIDNSLNITNVRDQLISIDETLLSTWFVDNYIRKCLQLSGCPQNISRLFADVRLSTRIELQDAVSALVAWKQNKSLSDVFDIFVGAQMHMSKQVYNCPLTTKSCVSWMTQLSQMESCYSVYFTAVAFLHVGYRSLRHGFSDELMDILATLCGQFTHVRRYRNNPTSVSSLNVAAKLMKVVANKPLSTMSLIEIELSKAYLYRALKCKDSDSDSIYCLANVYLAVLYHSTGQYQTAIDHCTLVTRSQDHSQCSSHVVQGEILPKIDDEVDIMLGLAELYQSVRTAALKQKPRAQLVSVFTTELFAYYLHIKYLLVTKCHRFMQISSTDEFKRYAVCISGSQQLFISDVLLFLSVSRLLKFHHEPVRLNLEHSLINANRHITSDLVELLQKSAVEHLTTYRELLARDFGSVATIVTTECEALYAYKRGDYQRCLQLSAQNVHTLLCFDFMPGIPILPEIIQLLDDDIVSLTALMLIVNPECRDGFFSTCMTHVTLSLYLMTQCQLKLLHPPVASLARNLDYIKHAEKGHPSSYSLSLLTLKLIERKVVAYLSTSVEK